jgi:hypothetical protein
MVRKACLHENAKALFIGITRFTTMQSTCMIRTSSAVSNADPKARGSAYREG